MIYLLGIGGVFMLLLGGWGQLEHYKANSLQSENVRLKTVDADLKTCNVKNKAISDSLEVQNGVIDKLAQATQANTAKAAADYQKGASLFLSAAQKAAGIQAIAPPAARADKAQNCDKVEELLNKFKTENPPKGKAVPK